MSIELDPQLRRVLADRVRYYNDLGIYVHPVITSKEAAEKIASRL